MKHAKIRPFLQFDINSRRRAPQKPVTVAKIGTNVAVAGVMS